MNGLVAMDRETLPTRTFSFPRSATHHHLQSARKASAPGYVFKVPRGADIEDSILAVARGEDMISAHLQVGLVREIHGRRRARQALLTHAGSTSYVSPPRDPNPACPRARREREW